MQISILIPCHNEEKSIQACISSCLKQTRRVDEIMVVDDASTDSSVSILEKFGNSIKLLKLKENTGNKSYVQEYGMKFIKGDIVIMTDADTLLDPNFAYEIEKAFKNPAVEAVCGYVKSLPHNLLTACRELDYIVGQSLHKQAQDYMNSFFVIPGCASAFRLKTFNKIITFDHDTLTEDLDFTYKFVRQGLKVLFEKNAVVYTQDPANLSSYINQMRRWYAGNWQNIRKHIKVLKNPIIAWDLSLVYLEGIAFSLMIFLLPFLNFDYFLLFINSYVYYSLILGLFGATIRKRIDLVVASAIYPILGLINGLIFLEQFIKEILLRNKNLVWYQPDRRAIT